jgi:hypothetical protein
MLISKNAAVADKEGIEDQTGTDLVNLRRTIYLTIMNSVCSAQFWSDCLLIGSISSTLRKLFISS